VEYVVVGLDDTKKEESASSHLDEPTDPDIFDKQTVDIDVLTEEQTITGTTAHTKEMTDPLMNVQPTLHSTVLGQSNY